MTIGEKIQKYRKQLELSQEELGQKLLVSRQTVSLWEKDQTVPTIDNIKRLREIFGISVDELLGSEDAEQNDQILPCELYQFDFSKEELNEIYRLQKRSIYKKPVLVRGKPAARTILASVSSASFSSLAMATRLSR